jgi:predicted pyridoxine 5'-phosphate oxidase superfamily flavin-nucleotide-binding protein
MIITDGVKEVVGGTAFLSLITINADGTPHPIVAGKGEIAGENIIFGIYKMEKTQANLLKNKNAWVIGATTINGNPKGYRLTGAAETKDKQLVFTVTKIEELI